MCKQSKTITDYVIRTDQQVVSNTENLCHLPLGEKNVNSLVLNSWIFHMVFHLYY